MKRFLWGAKRLAIGIGVLSQIGCNGKFQSLELGSTNGDSAVPVNFSVLSAAAAQSYKIAFVTAPQTVTAGNCSALTTVQLRNGSNQAVTTVFNIGLTFSSNDSSLVVYSDSACSQQITQGLTISTLQSSNSFYFRSSNAGPATITSQMAFNPQITGSQLESVVAATTPPPPLPPPVTSNGSCGMQLGAAPIFCEPFDVKNSGLVPGRTGDLDPNVWGVSRLFNNMNLGQGMYNVMAPVHIQKCDGTTPLVTSPNDILICNGQLREAMNDNLNGTFEGGSVGVIAMYPKQPFDFDGRTGTVSFDISNDTHGSHAAWPEFWMSDLPVPAPFIHTSGVGYSLPKNGFGVRFQARVAPGQYCGSNHDNTARWTVGSAAIVRNYVLDDSERGGQLVVTPLDCVTASPDNSGILNHVEVRVSQNQIDIYATDAGSIAPLKHIAVIANANLTLTRGLIWLEDVHYNADKAESGPNVPSQSQHTFVWDNVAFDGPFTYRDRSFDALDALTPFSGGIAGAVSLGKVSDSNQSSSWNVLNMPPNPQPSAVRILFNFYHYDAPTVLNVTVNGHAHPTPWPYPETLGYTQRTFAVSIPVTDLVSGTNVVTIGADKAIVTSNVNAVLVDVPGGVPVLPGSAR